MAAPELAVIGLTCNLVGVFFLANSIIFRKLRKVIQEFFGVRSRSINAIKDYTLNNIQVALGFLFLTVGFLLEICSHLKVSELGGTTVLVCGAIVILAFVVYVAGWLYSRRQFKRYLRQFFREHPESLNKEMVLTKEVGEFLGIPHDQETTAEDYLARVKRALGVLDEPMPRGAAPGPRRRGTRSAIQSR